MVDAILFTGILYLFLGVIFDISSEIALYRRVRLGKLIIKYGINEAKLLEKETRAYHRCISAIVSIGGLSYSLLALFAQTSELWITLAINIPLAVGLLLLGYCTSVLYFDKNFIDVFPTCSIRSFTVLWIHLLIYPFLILFILASLGLLIGELLNIICASITLSHLLIILVLTFPFMLGEWLFGADTLTDAVPETVTNPFIVFTLLAVTVFMYRSFIECNTFALLGIVTALLYFTLFIIGR